MAAVDPVHRCPKCGSESLTIAQRLETYEAKSGRGLIPGKDDLVSTTIVYKCDACGCGFRINLEEC
jgi:hypothetical protein